MSVLSLSHVQAQELATIAQSARPNEACGLLLGAARRVQQIVPITNIASHPRVEFQADPQAVLHALKQADARGWELVGVFHSHPQSAPLPSASDLADSRRAYPQMTHVIIGLAGQIPQLKAWHITQHDVEAVEISAAPDEPDIPALSPTQLRAVVLATLCAVILLILIAVSLLPAAPIIGAVLK